MTPATRMSAALGLLRWTASDVSLLCRVNERTVRRWLAGTYEPPQAVLDWLEALAAVHRHTPPPVM